MKNYDTGFRPSQFYQYGDLLVPVLELAFVRRRNEAMRGGGEGGREAVA